MSLYKVSSKERENRKSKGENSKNEYHQRTDSFHCFFGSFLGNVATAQVGVEDLAIRFSLPSAFLRKEVIEKRLGSIIKGQVSLNMMTCFSLSNQHVKFFSLSSFQISTYNVKVCSIVSLIFC